MAVPEKLSAHTYTRRDFLKIIGAGAAALGIAAESIFTSDSPELDLSFLNGVTAAYDTPLQGLAGVGRNIPFVWAQTEEKIEPVVSDLNENRNVDFVRMILEYGKLPLETELGAYQTNVTNRYNRFFSSLREDLKVIVPICDGFPIFHKNKPSFAYPTLTLSSPYLIDVSSPEEIQRSQMAFFTDPEIKEFYKRRAEMLIKNLQGNIVYELGNEIAVPIADGREVEILTNWCIEMIEFIRQFYDGPILTGLADPRMVDASQLVRFGNIITTLHAYLRPDVVWGLITGTIPFVQFESFLTAILNSPLPVIVEEIGVPSEVLIEVGEKRKRYPFQVPFRDQALATFISFLTKGSVDDEGKIHIAAYAPWHTDPYHPVDKHMFVPGELPLAEAILEGTGAYLREIFR